MPTRPPSPTSEHSHDADYVTAPKVRHGMNAMTAWKASVLSLVLFALLASGSLVKAARGHERGWQRDIFLPTANAIDRVANFLSLNRPLDWANGALNRDDIEPDIQFPPVTVPPVTGSTTTIAPRVISVTSPLRFGVFGDSQAKDLGLAMKSRKAKDPTVSVYQEGQVSTGLARPDFYNWPARLQEFLADDDVDAVVFMAGSNDDQTLQDRLGNTAARIGTQEWSEEYRRRVAGLMDLVNNGRHRLVWMGVPLVRDPDLAVTAKLINQIIRDEAATRPWVNYVDAESALAGPDGAYSDYLDVNGKGPVRCRRPDGVHLTNECLAVLSDLVFEAIKPFFASATLATTSAAPSTGVPSSGPPTTKAPR